MDGSVLEETSAASRSPVLCSVTLRPCSRTAASPKRYRRQNPAASLDQLSVFVGEDDWRFTLRWVVLHLIEETARHAGHADLLREAIDGTVGE